ncbi:MAG: hypothetical protein QOI96_613 [Verrucomicrobiota bacterium]
MKKMLEFYANRRLSTGILKTGLVLFVGVALGSAFWMASTPMAHGQGKLTPVEMIQSKLPHGKTIATATDAQLLEAVCKAVRQWPKQAAHIVRTAAGARKSLRTDILCTSIRCLREGHALDCVWVADIVREWIKAEPSEANRWLELIMECAPECRDLLQNLGPNLGEGNFGNPPINVNPPPGSVGGGAGGNVCIVCHNGQEIQVACSDLDNYLRGHPGDSAGPCQPTPVTNP